MIPGNEGTQGAEKEILPGKLVSVAQNSTAKTPKTSFTSLDL